MTKRPQKIDALTPAQERALIEYRERWLAVGRSTAPADRAKCEAVFRSMYQALGKPAPYVWWCDGPATGSIVRATLRDNLRANLWENLGENLWANLRDNLAANLGINLWANLWANLGANLRANLRVNLGANLADNLWDNLGANLGDNLGDKLGANLGDNLRDNLGANLGANLGKNLRDNLAANLGANLAANLMANLWDNLGVNLGANLTDNLWDNLAANLRDNLNWHFWGRHELYWPTYYLWPHEYVRPMYTDEQMERLGWWLVLSEHCGWWQPFEGIVFACEPPVSQTVDDAGRLHNESGPAIMCRDGWPVHAWHGVRVPAWVIERPEDITADKINQEPNAEVRRVMLERLGLERYLRTVDAKRIDAHDDGNLWLIEPPTEDDEPLKLLELTNWTDEPDGTRKKYIFSVPPGMERVLQAKAWMYRVEDGFYNPAIQT